MPRRPSAYSYSEDGPGVWTAQVDGKPRAAKCQRAYDRAAALQKLVRKEGTFCDDVLVGRAVLAAYAGPCPRAEKAYKKARASCRVRSFRSRT